MSCYHSHTLDIYGADLYLATTPRQWRKLAKRLKGAIDKTPPDAAGHTTFATWHPHHSAATAPVLVLWVSAGQHKTPGDLVDTVAHEASHAAGQLLAHAGHDTRGLDEPSAYLVGWLTRWMWERCHVG